jgi:hypothetical protein
LSAVLYNGGVVSGVPLKSFIPENTRWNFSYPPMQNEPGEVVGLLNVTD